MKSDFLIDGVFFYGPSENLLRTAGTDFGHQSKLRRDMQSQSRVITLHWQPFSETGHNSPPDTHGPVLSPLIGIH
jgi:hypothetical protein